MATKRKKAAAAKTKNPVPLDVVQNKILVIRDQRVLLDSDLAELYGTTTKRLNEQVRRNRDRFPEDFMFRLGKEEFAALRSHLATSNGDEGKVATPQRGGRRYPPNVFTEYGAIMVANVLNSPRATEASIFVVRAFVRLRDYLASTTRLAQKLNELESQVDTHDAAIRTLVSEIQKLLSPNVKKKRPVGFIIEKEKAPGR
jgi:hypothetical protein